MTDPNTPSASDSSSAEQANSGQAPASEAKNPVHQPRIKPKRQTRISWIWLVPLIAAVIGLSLVVKAWLHAGPTVTISFESADGIEVGQTKVRYKDVVIGSVKGIKVAPDRSKVIVKAELNREGAEYITRKGTRFWVVRPRLGASGVSGLGTLLSGAYIGVDVGKSSGGAEQAAIYDFKGLEKPPEITSDRPGTRFALSASDLGSLEIGSPIYYRHINVGRVIGYDLDANGKAVNIQIFVDAPNDKFVTPDTRFWDVSGINMSLNADGVTINTGSVASIVSGGVAFASANDHDTAPAKADTVFVLNHSEKTALAEPDGPAFPVNMEFKQSVRGLKVGAPIDFHGLELGSVADIDLEFDPAAKRFYVLVKTLLYPYRFGSVYHKLIEANGQGSQAKHSLLKPLIEHGLRAQMRSGNLLTGQQYIALDFFPDAAPVNFDDSQTPAFIPTVTGSFDRLQQQLSNIVGKIDAIPFEGISQDLRGSLKSLTAMINGLNTRVTPAAASSFKAAQNSLNRLNQLLGSDAPTDNLEQTLHELNNAAKSLRALADYLQTHPATLLRGSPVDALPVEH
jgi:paraquat-inducible protein B